MSLRQALTPRWTALGTVEWTNWSRLNEVDTVCTAAGAPFCLSPAWTVNSLTLGWHDGWFFSGGLEYTYSPKLTLRGGVAYDLSPIQNPDERIAQLPDSNRIISSVGASYGLNWCGTWCDSSSLSLAYAHVFSEDASIDRTENNITLLASTQSSADLISIGFKTQWGSSEGLSNRSNSASKKDGRRRRLLEVRALRPLRRGRQLLNAIRLLGPSRRVSFAGVGPARCGTGQHPVQRAPG